MICTRYKYKKCLSLDEYFSSMLLLGLLDVTMAIGVEANLDGIEASRRRRGIEAGLDVREHGHRAFNGFGIEAASRPGIKATSSIRRGYVEATSRFGVEASRPGLRCETALRCAHEGLCQKTDYT